MYRGHSLAHYLLDVPLKLLVPHREGVEEITEGDSCSHLLKTHTESHLKVRYIHHVSYLSSTAGL